jgi:hypothetical protein
VGDLEREKITRVYYIRVVLAMNKGFKNMSARDGPEAAFYLDFKKSLSLILPGTSEYKVISLFP